MSPPVKKPGQFISSYQARSVDYLFEKYTYKTLARLTGFGKYELSLIRRGYHVVSATEFEPVNRLLTKELYNDLTSLGANTTEARRYALAGLDTALEFKARLESVVNRLSDLVYEREFRRAVEEGLPWSPKREYERVRDSIIDAISKSGKPLNELEES